APSSTETTSSAQASLAAAAAAGLLRSHTGEMLAPVLASGTRAEREVFDPEAARARREGDVDLSRIGKEAKMPWEADGPRWHTVDRIAHNGNPARWEGAALEHVIDLLAAQPGFASRIDLSEPDWNNRTVVEVAGPAKVDAWLLHAMTGDEWLLTLKFRVQKRTFDEATLDAALGLKPIDDIDEIQVYGRGPRVKVRNLKGPWQEVSISVHWLAEIDTPAFREFLETAVASFGRYLEQRQQDPAELMPWKKLGRKWHLLRKGFPSGKKVFWEADTLDRLFDLVEELAPNHEATWTGRTVATWTPASNGDNSSGTDVRIYTKRRGGIDLVLLVEPGSIALGRIASLGHEREISQHSSGRDQVRLRFRRTNQVEHPELQAVLSEVL
ncbi:MAG: excinuclease ABC subunit A, partial [Planctomycetaceae bacterium]|nr:excinuclease ABC subunit A [Planctomycetaceae bacterium]